MSAFQNGDASVGSVSAATPASDDSSSSSRARACLQMEAIADYFQSADQDKNGILDKGELQTIVDDKSLAVSSDQREGAELLLSHFADVSQFAAERSSVPLKYDLDGIASTYDYLSLYDLEKRGAGVSMMDINATLMALKPNSEVDAAIDQFRSNLKWLGAGQAVTSAIGYIGCGLFLSAPEPTTISKILGVSMGVGSAFYADKAYESFTGKAANELVETIKKVRTTINSWDL